MDKDELLLSVLRDTKDELKEVDIRLGKYLERLTNLEKEVLKKVDRKPDFEDLKIKVEKIGIKTILYGSVSAAIAMVIAEIFFRYVIK